MLFAEKIRLGLFSSVVAMVFVFAAAALLRRFRGVVPTSRHRLWIERVWLGLAALGLFCIWYGYSIVPYRLTISHIRLESAKLPKGAAPIRIVQFSDLHSDRSPRLEPRIPAAI